MLTSMTDQAATTSSEPYALLAPASGLDIDLSCPAGENWAVLTLAGVLDLHSIGAAHDVFDQAASRRLHRLALHVSDLHFIDSAGLGVLLRAYKRGREHDGRICMVATQPSVARKLQMTGLDQVFPPVPDLDAARAYLTGPP
jgi:anti-sigma B factor antagonist